MTAVQGSITDDDIDEFTRAYSRADGWLGAVGLYRSMLAEGDELVELSQNTGITVPVLAIGAGGGGFTEATMTAAVGHGIESVTLDGVGHYAALEAPQRLAEAILGFVDDIR